MLVNRGTPPHARKSVSAGAIFKQRPKKTKKLDKTLQPVFHATNLAVDDAPGEHLHIGKLQSNSRRLQKENYRRSKKRSDEHPITVEFKGKSCNTLLPG